MTSDDGSDDVRGDEELPVADEYQESDEDLVAEWSELPKGNACCAGST